MAEEKKESTSLLKTYGPAPATTRGAASQINLSPDGSKMIYAQGKNIVVRDTTNPGLCEVYGEHQATTTVAKFSRSGHWIASADTHGKVRVWAWSNPLHQLKVEVQVFAGEVLDLDWGAENKRICAVGAGRGTMCKAFLWDTGNSVGEMPNHVKRVLSCSMKPGRPYRIVTGGEDMFSIHWQGPPFKFHHTNKQHKNFVNCVRYAPDGGVYATVSSDKHIFLYDGKSGEYKAALSDGSGDGHKGSIYSCAWSGDSSRLLTASGDKTVKLWDVETSQVITTFEFRDKAEVGDMQTGVAWSDPTIVSLSLSGDINFLDPNTGGRPINIVNSHQGPITSLSYAADSGCLASSDTKGTVQLWNEDIGRRVGGSAHTSNVRGVSVGAGKLTSVGWDNTARFGPIDGDYEGGAALPAQPVAMASTPDSAITAVITRNSVSIVIGDTVASSQSTAYDCKSVAISADGSQVAVGGSDMKIYLFPLTGDQLAAEGTALEGHRGQITALAFSPDSAFLAAGDAQREVKLWDMGTGKVKIQGRWTLHGTTITCLAFSPSGKFVASGSMDNNVFIWNTTDKTKKPEKIALAHKDGVTSVAFTAEDVLVSAGQDSCIRHWDVCLPH